MNQCLKKSFLAGVFATMAMLLASIIGDRIGIPMHDWTHSLTETFGHGKAYGYLAFFAFGICGAVIYGKFMHQHMPGNSPWMRGLFYGALLWLFSFAIVSPLLKMGFFMGSMTLAFGSSIAHLFYGTVLGFIYHTDIDDE